MTKSNADWWRHAGNANDTIKTTLSKSLGDDLSAVSSVAATLRHTVTGVEQALSATVTDSAEREVTIDLGTWLQSTAVAGDFHYVSVDVTTTGGGVFTFPEALKTRPILGIV